MKILMVQSEILTGRTADNLSQVEGLLNASGPDADVIVLPELFATGFRIQPAELAADASLIMEWMRTEALRRNAAVVGSVAVAAEGRFVNRLFFVSPDGSVQHYDKRHLFGYGGEKESFSAGHERRVVSFRGVRFLLQVCYDLRFPVFSRNHADYDVALYVANWPAGRRAAWDILLRARAVENQCFVVGVNRVGHEGGVFYDGDSAVYDFQGQPIAACPSDKAGVATALLPLARMEAFRRSFPVLKDADKFRLL